MRESLRTVEKDNFMHSPNFKSFHPITASSSSVEWSEQLQSTMSVVALPTWLVTIGRRKERALHLVKTGKLKAKRMLWHRPTQSP